MTEPSAEQVREAGQSAIDLFLERVSTDLSTQRFVIVCEGLSEEGRRGTWITVGDNQQEWETQGLLTWALNVEPGIEVETLEEDE